MTRIKLSENFYLDEFERSKNATKFNVDNKAPADVLENLKNLCINVLQPIRDYFGEIRITSGYRSQRVNELAGGSKNSQHMKGEAADIYPIASNDLYGVFRKTTYMFNFDQCIYYPQRQIIHISLAATGNQRKEAMFCIDGIDGKLYVPV